MHQIIQMGDKFHPQSIQNQHSALPQGIYTVMFNDIQGYYLVKNQEKFVLPSKIYNDPTDLINRWLKAWASTQKNMGIFLTGYKGTGKTITAQMLCNLSNMPVIIITEAYTNEGFKQFIADPCFKNCIIFIDEFEKVYAQEDKDNPRSVEHLLSLLDGMYDTRFMFVLTTNSDEISPFLTNRPGRVKYRTDYGYLTPKDAVEVVRDRLKNLEHEKSVYKMLDYYGNCTMDILTKVIDDMNLFNEPAMDCAKYMNLSPESVDYGIEIELVGTTKRFKCNPWYNCTFQPDEESSRFAQLTTDSHSQLAQALRAQGFNSVVRPIERLLQRNIDVDFTMNEGEEQPDRSILFRDLYLGSYYKLDEDGNENHEDETVRINMYLKGSNKMQLHTASLDLVL